MAKRITQSGAAASPSLTILFPFFFVAVLLSHFTLLRLPYFWDEAGYYIPAAWDLFRIGTLIPVTTASNAHPPLPSLLLAGWWHIFHFAPVATRVFICVVSSAALLAVYRMARNFMGAGPAAAVTFLTAIYPVWFAQSTLAHADIFAAAFTLWALSFYLNPEQTPAAPVQAAILFALAALSKETAIITPAALAAWETVLLIRDRRVSPHLSWIASLTAPILPLAAWYIYHHHRTGFYFGNPEFLRYNATANLDAHRIVLCLYHRLLHLTMHMNLFVPVTCALAAMLLPRLAQHTRLPRAAMQAIAVILLANWVAFSILGGALLTRYLLPMYPLVLLLCVAEWRLHFQRWQWLAAFSAVAFLFGIWINPPYAFAPEDNLTYRDFIVLHERAVAIIGKQWPQATVLTAWPAFSELERPELGYTTQPIKAVPIQNFTLEEIQKAAANPGDYDTALLFSTKWAPAHSQLNIARGNAGTDTRYFDFHEDVSPAEAAELLHGELVWQDHIRGEWVAILRFPRVENAALAH